MKNYCLLFLMGLLCLVAQAVPADPTPATVTQPDGTELTVVLHGDEFFHFTTTTDGYTVIKNESGFYTYARMNGDRLVPGDRIARNVNQRSTADLTQLAATPKYLTDNVKAQDGKLKLNRRNSAMRRVGADGLMDYERFRGLIILINYNDKSFSMSNASSFYDDMVNTQNYTGYTLNGRHVNMTGSVRDYFYDNSAHIFDPAFDVVGPVDVDFSCTYPEGTSNAEDVFEAALRAVDDDIDFNDYDSDGDGYVDMVFFLVAGYSANYSGNNQAYLWPHMYYLYWAPFLDDVGFGLYACSTEIAGWEGSWADVNGIGTICHEFGHVLGLPDLYDTDYNGTGGESRNPGEWSVMAGGSGSNFGRNPVGYSLYERYALGFTTPRVIDTEGTYTLSPLDESNIGFRLNTPNQNEFFLIENRQSGKWDRFLPGHGMMIARVDSTNERIWWSNEVNCNPNHMYYDLLRASYSGQDSGSDPFPGTKGVTEINNFTNPSLQTWDKQFNEFGIANIAERSKTISFNLEHDNSILSVIEDFENMPVSEQNASRVPGVFCKWDFIKCSVQEVEEADGSVHKAVGMIRPSQMTSSAPLEIIPYLVEFSVKNPTTTAAKVRLYYSLDQGQTWVQPADGVAEVSAKSHAKVATTLPTTSPIMLRFAMTSGNTKNPAYLDDIKLYYRDKWDIHTIEGDVNKDGEVNIADVNVVVGLILDPASIEDPLTTDADVNGDGEINIADVNMIIDMILSSSL